MKTWVKALIISLVSWLVILIAGSIYYFFTAGMRTTIEYGVPHYRPKAG